MINIKELSIGNWIRNTNGNIGKVIGITEQGEVIVRYSENSTCYSEPRVLESVEITPEILEKNGWEVRVSDIKPKKWIAFFWENASITHDFVDEDKMFAIIYSDEGEMRLEIRYVHQLQNALTLCGIDKEIEL